MKYTERLSRIILLGIYLAIAIFALNYFGSIVSYIALALVVTLISKPIMGLFQKVKIKGKVLPDVFLSILTLLVIISVLSALVAGLLPVIRKVVVNISSMSEGANFESLSFSLGNLNLFLRDTLNLEPDFRIEALLLQKLSSVLSLDLFGNVLGTVASTFAGIGAGFFSVVFIAFFLIKDKGLVSRIIYALTPEKHSEHIGATVSEVERLLSRYFLGIIIEIAVVSFIDFIGLWTVAKLHVDTALGIAVMAGLLNIIPYIGPLFGGVLGGLMAIVVKFCGVESIGINVDFWGFVAILVGVFLAAQIVDAVVLQPVIYSKSVQSHPLEIFIAMLVGGAVYGIVGMLISIPVYTVMRVFVVNFYPENRAVKVLLKSKG